MSQRELESKAQTGTTVHRQPAEERDEEEEHPIARLQQQYGNRAVGQMLDRRAEDDAEVAPEIEEAIQRARGGGQALDSGVRAQMEPAFGADFSGVQVHADAQADRISRALNARAFTTGQNIFFRQGAYSPGSSSGRELLAHELTHVVQQAGGVRQKLTVGGPDDVYEQEADRVARAVLRQEQQPIRKDTDQGLVQRQHEEEEQEEISVQAETEESLIQQQTEDDEEEPVQTKVEDAWVQRQAEEEEEPIQAKVEGLQVQRQIEEEEIEDELIQTEASSVVQRDAEASTIPEDYWRRQRERTLHGHRERVRRLTSPYKPARMSRNYYLLPHEWRVRVVKQANEWFRWEYPGATWQLDWNNPRDRPMARAWLRIRDEVMKWVWSRYVGKLAKRTTAQIAGGMKPSKEPTETEKKLRQAAKRIEQAEAEDREEFGAIVLRQLEALRRAGRKILAATPSKMKAVENYCRIQGPTFQVLVPVREPEATGVWGEVKTGGLRKVELPFGKVLGKQKETQVMFLGSTGASLYSNVIFKQYEETVDSLDERLNGQTIFEVQGSDFIKVLLQNPSAMRELATLRERQ